MNVCVFWHSIERMRGSENGEITQHKVSTKAPTASMTVCSILVIGFKNLKLFFIIGILSHL